MTKEKAKLLMMDYIYGEMDDAQAKEFEAFLTRHDDLRNELEELTETKSLLKHLPVQSPAEQLVMMEPEESTASSGSWWNKLTSFLPRQSGFSKAALALASFVVLFFVLGGLTNMTISTGENGFSLTFGEQTPAQTGYTAAQVELIINQVQQENAELIQEYILASQEQQELQFQQTLATFADYIDQQRTEDLQLINYGLTSLEETTYNRFRQTDQVLGEIIQTVSTN